MSRIVTFNPEAREKLSAGVNTLANAVAVTLGPRGRNVVIDTYGVPAVTKDGVTVAKYIQLADPVENLGAQIINQSASRTAKMVGDGTTTATVIAQELINKANELIAKGVSPIIIKRSFESLLETTLAAVLEKSIPVDDLKVKDIAVISANNDEGLGSLIASAFTQVGREGILTVEDSKSNQTYIKVVDGVSINRGFLSPYFITDPNKLEAVYENPVILITDKKVRSTQEIVPILEDCAKAGRPLLILSDELEAQALSLLVLNRIRNGLPVVAINAPAYGDRRLETLKDLATLTGATLFTEQAGLRLEDARIANCGSAAKIIVGQSETTFIEPKGSSEEIANRAAEIRAKMPLAENDYDLERLTERLARLVAKVAVLYVGAPTETEMKEKKDRIDDAIRATRAAINSGFVPGGGTIFFDISKKLAANEDQDILDAFKDALTSPIRKIIENAGQDPNDILPKITSTNLGYDAAKLEITDLIKAGVIDPTSVLLESLTSAVSAANMVILSEVTIHETTPKYQPMGPNDYGQ